MGHSTYPFIHINDITLEEVAKILDGAKLVSDGDCGSVWGEVHSEPHHRRSVCPNPHVIIVDGDSGMLEVLEAAGVGYVADKTSGWGAGCIARGWREDDECLERTDTEDHRKPYVARTSS